MNFAKRNLEDKFLSMKSVLSSSEDNPANNNESDPS